VVSKIGDTASLQAQRPAARRLRSDLAQVGLGDDEQVRNLHHARLQELQRVAAARLAHGARPNRPVGRNSSTTAMMTKMTVLEASG